MISISEIHLKNFKSFKNTKLKIPDGFTAILGPNGSGKSNTIDGICFVLGKTSAKSLRAGKFNQLITYHNGKRADYAEVTLFFDNNNREIPIDSDKVGICRKVKLNGDNNYYVVWYEDEKQKKSQKTSEEKTTNKKSSKVEKRRRMKKNEVLDLLSKISLIADGPNIILQGDLLRIIDTSPYERRKILDEVSGVAEFDEKAEKAKKELSQAREYIEKIDIRINEVRANLEKLKKEKEDAEKYKIYNKKLKVVKYVLTSKKVEFLKMVLDETKDEIEALKETKNCYVKDISNIDGEIIELKVKINDLVNELNEKGSEEVMELHKSIKELEVNLNNDKNALENAVDDLKHTLKMEESKNKDLGETKEKINDIRIDTLKKESEAKLLIKEIEKLNEERQNLEKKVEQSESQVKTLKSQESKLSERINDTQKELYGFKDELNQLNNTLNTKNFEYQKNNETIGTLTNQIAEFSNLEDTKKLYKELEDIAVELEFSKKKLQENICERNKNQSKLDNLHSEYVKENARIKALKDMENFSLDRAVKGVLDANLPGVINIAGNLAKTKGEYKTAIEVAGGARLNHIVVKKMDDGSRAINYLKQKRLGRATFLPMDRIKGMDARDISDNGIVGKAIDLVEFDIKYTNVFKFIFGNTHIVDNLENAKKLSLKHKARFVTLEGEVIEPSGAMVGGNIRRNSAIKVDIDMTKLTNLSEDIKELEQTLSNVKDEIERLNNKINTYSSRKLELDNRLKIARDQEYKKEEITKSNNLKIKELELLNSKIDDEISELTDEKEIMTQKVQSLDNKLSEVMGQRERIVNEIKSYENSELSKRIKEIDYNIRENENNKNNLENEIKKGAVLVKEVLIPKISELNSNIKSLADKKSMFKNNVEIYKSNIESNSSILTEKREKYEELTKGLKDLTDKKECYEIEIENLQDNKEELREKSAEIDNQVNVINVDRAKYETRLEEEERKLYLCDTLENIEDITDEMIEETYSIEIDELERSQGLLENNIKKLEPVNMRAIEDYDFINERYEELFGKRKEYEQEEQKYLQLIAEVQKRKKETFMATYVKVAEYYGQIYGEIGGNGKLSLENEEDPFSGGLLIDASPMNKQLQNLDVMSGGEKSLTALAFLFAIQRLNPSPFYVLDEVDAALDTKNASLIGDMISNASKESQFIVISHREQMISKSNVMYGVCMENGLSKIVSVKL
ncbi:chromosome segregation protein SMC [Methanococcus voltae]|uniref:Chromosome partition protein Smc n=1 Tax=Methanococcus voltae (strain ATCC BAA-1334 / A3) TaxID=456320 RepID=D7DU10_METV3|nr:chromosome segregation protein SMC [Methanococcus voltae]MCS3900420.1 chromosome segregation protein [Methanococcus voltae]